MPTNEEQILAWAKKALGFASSADAVTFAANGALIMASSIAGERATYKILVADSTDVVQWLGIRNVTGNFSMANVTPWLTGTVGESGIAADMVALSSPPKMRNGNDIVRVASIKYFMQRPGTQRPAMRMEWLNLQSERGQSPVGEEIPSLLRAMTYQDYLHTDHWIKMRAEALERALHRCALCNTNSNLHVHHRTYERLGQELPADLTVLCDECHNRFHDRLPTPPSDSTSTD